MLKSTILIVDDDVFFRTFCAEVLQAEGYAVHTASTGHEALDTLGQLNAALVLADIYMPGMTGIELLEMVKGSAPSLDVIIMTGYASIDTAIQAIKSGAADYLRKPFSAEELSAVVEATLAQRQLYQENERLKGQLELFEATRSFASSEDAGRVLELGLGVLLRAAGAEGGVCLHTTEGGVYMELMHENALGDEAAKALREGLVSGGLRLLRHLDDVVTTDSRQRERILGGVEPLAKHHLMLVPVCRHDQPESVFAIVRNREAKRFTAEDEDRARFLGRQIELSYGNARRLQDAKQLAYIDSLTDLYNARYLEEALDKAIAEAQTSKASLSVLFLDLDCFKEVNDAYGHIIGGKTLIEVSRILKGCVRDEDVLVRYGGDEFTVLLPRTDPKGAREVADRIRKTVKDHVFLGREGRSIRLTTSVGIATYPFDAETREELINRADQAMYRNKAASRDAVYTARAR